MGRLKFLGEKSTMAKYTERVIDLGPLRFNPAVSLISFVTLWGLTIWCMTDEISAKNELVLARDWVAYWFTWLYIGSQDVWIVFALYVYAFYGNKKMCAPGDEDKKPEFGDASYFMMLFTCGVAVGMFYYGTTEPTSYYTGYSGNRYAQDPGISDSEKAQWAITLSVFHWGLHGWIPYCIVALTIGFASYRQSKPLTMRSSLYPLLGDRVNGWIGDSIDILAIVVVIAGVCTSLGLGTDQIAQGIYRMNTDNFDYTDDLAKKQAWTAIICGITVVACCSVVSGIHNGIKTIAIVAFMLANFLLIMVFFMDDAFYSLDIMVQTVGHYLQYFLELGFATDAFQRQKSHGNAGFGQAVEGVVHGCDNSTYSSEVLDAVNKPGYIFPGAPADTYDGVGGNPKFMQWWTIFYWGWWIAWSPFVGMFIARISKGRTVREVFNYSMTAPLFYVIVWFSVFGGAGIKMHNTALECAAQSTLGFGGTASAKTLTNPYTNVVTTVPTGDGDIAREYQQSVCCEITTPFRKHSARVTDCTKDEPIDPLEPEFPVLDSGAWEILTVIGPYNATKYPSGIVSHDMCEYLRPQNYNEDVHKSMTNYLKTFLVMTDDEKDFLRTTTSVSVDDSRRVVYKFKYDNANFYEILEQYYGWGEFLSGVTICTIILYFVTSSDSGSFVVDLISAGGNRDKDGKEKDPHPVQRVVWSLTEGGVAIGLMYAGGTDGTAALQAMSVAVGLPFTIVICFMMPSLLRMLAIEEGGAKAEDWDWNMPILGGFLDIFDCFFSGFGQLGGCPSLDDLVKSFTEMIFGLCPAYHSYKTLTKLDVDGKSKTNTLVLTLLLFLLWVLCVVSLILGQTNTGSWYAFIFAPYLAIVTILANIRGSVREDQAIKGNVLEDFLACFFVFFNAGPQCWLQVSEPKVMEQQDAIVNPTGNAYKEQEVNAIVTSHV